VSDKIHAAGLKFGMHNLDMVVDKMDELVRPVPPQVSMMYPDRRRTSWPRIVGASETFLPHDKLTLWASGQGGTSRAFHGRDLRIDDEIITYDDLKVEPPSASRAASASAAPRTLPRAPQGRHCNVDNFSEFIDFYRPDVKERSL